MKKNVLEEGIKIFLILFFLISLLKFFEKNEIKRKYHIIFFDNLVEINKFVFSIPPSPKYG